MLNMFRVLHYEQFPSAHSETLNLKNKGLAPVTARAYLFAGDNLHHPCGLVQTPNQG